MKQEFYRQELRRSARPDMVEGAERELMIQMAIHRNLDTGRIVINYPGYKGNVDGYNNKYIVLANFMQEKIGAVIRMNNNHYDGFDYGKSIQDDLRSVISFAIGNSEYICGAWNPAVYLMGFSAGASAIAAVAHEFAQVCKILLVSPSADAGKEAIARGLAEYDREIYVLAGERDEVVGPQVAPAFCMMAKKASFNRLVILGNCDHQLRGRTNGLFLSKAPLWAFLGDSDFPSTEGGIVLYD